MNTKEFSVDQKKYLGNNKNLSSIYASKATDRFYSPFNIIIKPMEKLLLVDFEGHSKYATIELQMYDDNRGKGATIIVYHKDGKNEVYYSDIKFADKNLFKGNLFENKKMKYAIDLTHKGLHANLDFNDRHGKKISVKIKENRSKNKLVSMLAPIGGVLKTFTYFPFFYMKEFNFVKRSKTDIAIVIDNVKMNPKNIPIFVNGELVYLSRYAIKPIIAEINNDFSGQLKPLILKETKKFKSHDLHYSFTENQGHKELKKILCLSYGKEAGILFSPPIPDIVHLKDNIVVKGRFSIESKKIKGIVSGEYTIIRNKKGALFNLKPINAYSPMSGEIWVNAYNWNATLLFQNSKVVKINSKWIKKL